MRLNRSFSRNTPLSLRTGKGGKGRPKRDDGLEREPVEPPRPRPLSGGAAAELEFDE